MTQDETITEKDAVRPTPERVSKGGVVIKAVDRDNPHARPWEALGNDVIDQYRKRGWVSEEQHSAGVQFGSVWARAGLEPRVTLDPNRIGKSNNDLADTVVAARQLMLRLRAEIGPDIFACVEHVCGWNDWADKWAKARSIEPRAGMSILRLGLNGAARFWEAR